ncbi:beta-galactosidase trimerization domain-containing protein [Paenibacillus glycanilyticus]|uniref:beta-galactosidase trimerization domain-containing protein n=1 Tax=Paenibacillus glycanilyticus TaxID=126569 RepID=UPI003EBACB68
MNGSFGAGTASMWCDVLKLTGAEMLANYESHYYKGTPAVTVNTFGKGHVYYVGCDLDDVALNKLMNLIIEREGIARSLPLKYDGVEAIERSKDGQRYLMLLNHKNESIEVELRGTFEDALSGEAIQNRIILEPYAAHALLKR